MGQRIGDSMQDKRELFDNTPQVAAAAGLAMYTRTDRVEHGACKSCGCNASYVYSRETTRQSPFPRPTASNGGRP